MTVVLLFAAVIVGVAFAAFAYALKSTIDLANNIDERANAERHVLAGRIQNPNIFPTAPVHQQPLPVVEEPPSTGFEQAGRDASHLTPEQFVATFGEDAPDGR